MKTLLTTVAALVLVAGCSSTQPPPPCLAAHGSYAVAYTNTGGTPTGTCQLTYSIVGVQKYNQKPDAGVPVLPTLAIRPIEIGWNDSSPGTIAVGTFKAEKPDEKSFCEVPAFDNSAAWDRGAGAGTLSFKFSNVKLYVEAKSPGTQMSFDVEVEDTAPAASCKATYTAQAVWPVVACAYLGNLDANDNPAPIEPSDALCAQVDPWWSYLALNPDFDVKCVTDPNDWLGQWNSSPTYTEHVGAFCVARKPIPSFCPANGCDWRPKN